MHVKIADDLEAHFYVLLYHAVRYLRSNCTNVPNWIEDFFDVFTIEDGQYKCGYKSISSHSKVCSVYAMSCVVRCLGKKSIPRMCLNFESRHIYNAIQF